MTLSGILSGGISGGNYGTQTLTVTTCAVTTITITPSLAVGIYAVVEGTVGINEVANAGKYIYGGTLPATSTGNVISIGLIAFVKKTVLEDYKVEADGKYPLKQAVTSSINDEVTRADNKYADKTALTRGINEAATTADGKYATKTTLNATQTALNETKTTVENTISELEKVKKREKQLQMLAIAGVSAASLTLIGGITYIIVKESKGNSRK